jgi:hypothetical protein
VRGRVTGRIWLAGIAEPLRIDLRGDCDPDLAGCLLTLENPPAVPLTTRPPAAQQRGTAGTITAARKVRVFDVSTQEAVLRLKRGETPPEHMANAVYIAWFSKLSGEIVISSADYRLQISEPVWRFTKEEIVERERSARDEGEGSFMTEIRADGREGDWDEFRYEQMLRESDMLGDKFGRLLDKYADHPDQERIVAHEMGWTHLDAEEKDDGVSDLENEVDDLQLDFDPGDFAEELPDPTREGIDWVRDADGEITHPIAKRATNAFYALMKELKVGDGNLANTDGALGEFYGQFMVLHVKLASALGFIARERTCDGAMIVAWLKRALEIHNDVLKAATALEGHGRFGADRLAHYRHELLEIRQDVLAVVETLRGAQS